MKDSTIKHFNPMALREKYSAGNVQRTNPFSSFWADNDWDTRRTDILGEDDKPIYREDGKVMKGPNFSEPDLKSILQIE